MYNSRVLSINGHLNNKVRRSHQCHIYSLILAVFRFFESLCSFVDLPFPLAICRFLFSFPIYV